MKLSLGHMSLISYTGNYTDTICDMLFTSTPPLLLLLVNMNTVYTNKYSGVSILVIQSVKNL